LNLNFKKAYNLIKNLKIYCTVTVSVFSSITGTESDSDTRLGKAKFDVCG